MSAAAHAPPPSDQANSVFTAMSSVGPGAKRTTRSRPLTTLPRPLGCSSQGSDSFVGGGSNNTAGGSSAGVLAGGSNKACDDVTAALSGNDNIIGDGGSFGAMLGGASNSITGSGGAVIADGSGNAIGDLPPYGNSNLSAIAAGNGNGVGSPDSFIGAGVGNSIVPPFVKLASGDSPNGFIGAGDGNAIVSDDAVIVGGFKNSNNGEYAVIGGGYGNAVGSFGALIGSGQSNAITQNGTTGGAFGAAYSVISGGLGNSIVPLISNGAHYGAIGGGHGNTLSAFNGVIAGGEYNSAKGDYAAIPGGLNNTAGGVASFAAGSGSQALHNGTFLWSDGASPATPLKSVGVNEFFARASGGVAFYTSSTLKSGAELFPGSGTWASLSDRAVKKNIVALDSAGVLAKVETLPITEWSYDTERQAIRHIGPMAQDFSAAFGVGADDRHITTIDEDGATLAAIKALAARNAALEARSNLDDAAVADLGAMVRKLHADVALLKARLSSLAPIRLHPLSQFPSLPKG